MPIVVAESYRGLAQFAGCAMKIDVIVQASAAIQDAGVTQKYEVDKVQDSLGADCSKRARNEMYDLKISMKAVGTTAALARAINTINVGGFLPPFQTVVISQPDAGPQMPAIFIGSWSTVPGMQISAKALTCGEIVGDFERYADAAQNTLMISTPA